MCMTVHHMGVRELLMVVDCHLVLGTQRGSSARAAGAPHQRVESAALRVGDDGSEFLLACFLSLYFPVAVLCLLRSSPV